MDCGSLWCFRVFCFGLGRFRLMGLLSAYFRGVGRDCEIFTRRHSYFMVSLEEIADGLLLLSDEDLSAVAEAVKATQIERALDAGDVDSLVLLGFRDGFSSKGVALMPWIVDSMLIVPGSLSCKIGKTSHECVFVRVGDSWSWESGDLVLDKIENTSDGQVSVQRSISVFAAFDGLEFEVIVSRFRGGGHKMVSGSSYIVKAGVISPVGFRSGRDSSAPAGLR